MRMLTPEELAASEESGNAPSEFVGCLAFSVLLAIVGLISVCGVYGCDWMGVAP